MSGGITGDGFARLDELVARLDGDRLQRAIVDGATEAVAFLAATQYAAGIGPDGAAWPPNQDGGVPLTGATSQIVFRATGTGIEASAPDVLRYHETTRPVFPVAGELSSTWAAAADTAANEIVGDLLGKGG